jgi:hypothetical protein
VWLGSLVWLAVASPASADPASVPSPSASTPTPPTFMRPGPMLSGNQRRFNPKLGLPHPAGSTSAAAPGTPTPAAAPLWPAPLPSRAPVAPAAPPRPVPTPPATAATRPKPRPRKPPPPALPSPAIELTLDAPSPDAPWTLRAKNTGDVPLRLTADGRIAALDVTLPGAHKGARPIRCELPADMRPADDDDRELVVPPGRTYAEKIDARLFCFGAHDAAALVPGASVVPRLVGSHDVPVVAPVDDGTATLATLTELTGAATTIGPALPSTKDTSHARPLTLGSPAFVDAERAPDAAVTITAKNDTSAPLSFLFRPETIALDVMGPSGIGVTDPSPTVRCAWQGASPAPIRELFSQLPPKATDSLTILPSALCPDGTFDQPGLYLVRGRLDTRRTSGASIGLHTLNAEVAGEGATRLRVRAPTNMPKPLPKPQLEPLPATPAAP